MKLRRGLFGLSLIYVAGLLAACAGKEGGAGEPLKEEPPKPVTIKIAWSVPKEQYNKILEHPYVKQHLAHVTFEFMGAGFTEVEQSIVAGTAPDIIQTNASQLRKYGEMGLMYDMNALLKQQQVNMNRFVAEELNAIREYSTKGELYGVPNAIPEDPKAVVTPFALVYNKDIFDQFATPYPKDNMTWDEVIDLARKMTRTDGGIAYKGLDIHNAPRYLPFAYGIFFTDHEGKVDIANPGWADVLRVYKRAYDEQDGYLSPGSGYLTESFLKTKNVAMYAGNAEILVVDADKYEGQVNWDLVTYPKFANRELVWPSNPGVYSVTQTSKHKEDALRVITAFLSEEVQKESWKMWKNPTFLSNKNYKAIQAMKPLKYIASPYDTIGNSELAKKLNDMVKKGTDINTTLRTWKEETEKLVEQEKRK